MAFVPIANACAVELRFTYFAQRCALTLGFSRPAPFTVGNLQTIADLLSVWWTGTARFHMHQQVELREVYARALDSETAPSYISTIGAGIKGGYTPTSPLPSNVAFCISFRTTQRGRANRGRNYWFGMGVGMLSSNTTMLTSGNANAIAAYYQRLLPGGASDPTPARWCVLSRQIDGVVTGRAVPIVSVVVVDLVTDSMRRRLPGRGL